MDETCAFRVANGTKPSDHALIPTAGSYGVRGGLEPMKGVWKGINERQDQFVAQ
jgi:hypothetical protein